MKLSKNICCDNKTFNVITSFIIYGSMGREKNLKFTSDCHHTCTYFNYRAQISLFSFFFFYPLLLALPEVSVHDLSEDWDFLVLACDGIWDVLTNQVSIRSFSIYKTGND